MGKTGLRPSACFPTVACGGHRRARRHSESGNVIVLVAILLPLFMLCGAMTVDVGYWWVNAKKAQIAADACALAAAQSIPTIDPTGTECVIEPGSPDYVLVNLPVQGDASPEPLHSGTEVVWPYDADATMVEATVHMKVGTFFGRIVGLHGVDVTRRAVAERSQGVNEVAIHAHDTNCGNDAIVMNGEDIDIEGIVESNGFFEVNGKRITTGPATGGGPSSCAIKVDGEDISFGGQDEPTVDPNPHAWPVYFVPGEDPFGWPNSCDFVGQNIEFDTPNEVIPPGVYCASESFEVKAEGISGNITVFAPLIKVNDKNTTFAPSQRALDAGKPLLFMHLPNSTLTSADDGPEPFCEDGYRNEMTLNAENINWVGILFNPCDEIRVNGANNAALEGMIVAQTVRINGLDFNLQKISVAGTNTSLALVE